jgi:hypothetical protein
MKTWELIEAVPVECTLDGSGIYTVIHRRTGTETHKQYQDSRVFVRCDIMSSDDTPLISFQGLEDDVRKNVIRWIGENGYAISAEHGSYIGRELFKAVHDFHYKQD